MSNPVEWNPWYPYTDSYINEDIFKANVDKCKELGVDVCTLDAGWFGPSDHESEWYYIRGDWHKINLKRFPSGIRALSDYTHSKGLKFGLWCEIEAVGAKAELNDLQPELIARRNGNHLGYLCMGNSETVKWAFSILETLIVNYGVDWIKLDFNISPGAGCNRTDHGHGEGDGLYEHYMGYYHLLDMVREKYPQVLLENCSGGGLRTDLGIMKHMHLAFLSDPDYPLHALQVFWGATAMLHPSTCLHWAWSETTGGHSKNGDNNPIKNDMPLFKFDYIIRNALLKNPGFSYKLDEFPQWCLERLTYHIEFYKTIVKSFIREADFYRLTGQAIRTGEGDRWNGYAYINED
jgi:alpha-galactosidase